ncbi:hypothetical protein K439DRAFT_1615664 [Ramaria rubella]|nr:hypothetical protein K439DRAFT_1615664 [Ramaria rubella]
MWSELAITWITLNLIGQFSLLVLLITFYYFKTLPQRNNHYLVNFLLTVFLATVPTTLLFWTGNQGWKQPPHNICVAQAVLMDGVGPMYSTALVILAFRTWEDVRAVVRHQDGTTQLKGSSLLEWMLLLCPYFALAGWCAASFFVSLQPSVTYGVSTFVFCASGGTKNPVRNYIGLFMITSSTFQFLFEGSTRLNLKGGSPTLVSTHIDSAVGLTLLIILLSIIPMFLSLVNMTHEGVILRPASQVFESMNLDFAGSFISGGLVTQAVFQAWGIQKQTPDIVIDPGMNGDTAT